ncbi:hypothetical protein BBK36DRAFT_8680 [Trichoderma citrinoviride]|uniref:CENP-V/GFA domain-containing protein n=1 Tax=Trichoderma citrinoviride TaxID=58853 RepID=A0A2T4AY48_9HYPO|nr:hypothetical protein BBK36DRAFT_8680 [Trichoderma citrinoviride]PTB62004.1 hypothetical protein BBK36DRAFT_8680 [Trichoderma citrinoviride]
MSHQPDQDSKPQRLPYKGSCHCGAIRYVVFLTVPPPSYLNKGPPPRRGVQRIYRCNCTICHKIGTLHLRPTSEFDDFFLLSPLDPLESLGDYMCNAKTAHYLFCKTCGIRCFTFGGEGEIVDVTLPEVLALADGASGSGQDGVSVKAWRPKKVEQSDEGSHENSYLSVNGQTIEPGQEGFDLREWAERKAIMYLDYLADEKDRLDERCERPHFGGAY